MGLLYNQTNISINSVNVQLVDVTGTTELSLDSSAARFVAGKPTAASQISFSDFRGKKYATLYSPGINTSVTATEQFLHKNTIFDIGVVGGGVSTYGANLDDGYTDFSYISANPVLQSTLFNSNLQAPEAVYYSNFNSRIGSHRVPSGVSQIRIYAWGGGGGSGGSWTSTSTPGNGGAGGYATTTLTVGVDVFVGQVLHFIPGFGGAGGTSQWHSGTGGWASAVYVTDGPWEYPTSTTEWGLYAAYTSKFNATNCILIAGGGGGGGAINWSLGSAGHGGSGGSRDSGSGSYSSGANTGALTTSHGAGTVPTAAGSINGAPAGGINVTASTSSGGLSVFNEANLITLAPSSVVSAASSADRVGALTWLAASCGGGGAYCGNGGPRHIADLGETGAKARGGGGGSSKVYKGTGSTESAGISSTPPQGALGSSFNSGYGGVGKGPQNPNSANRYAGVSGTPGSFYISYIA